MCKVFMNETLILNKLVIPMHLEDIVFKIKQDEVIINSVTFYRHKVGWPVQCVLDTSNLGFLDYSDQVDCKSIPNFVKSLEVSVFDGVLNIEKCETFDC